MFEKNKTCLIDIESGIIEKSFRIRFEVMRLLFRLVYSFSRNPLFDWFKYKLKGFKNQANLVKCMDN